MQEDPRESSYGSPTKRGRPRKRPEDYKGLTPRQLQARMARNRRRQENYLRDKMLGRIGKSKSADEISCGVNKLAVSTDAELPRVDDIVKITYKPFPHQKAFADALREGRKIVAIVGGRQCGKTHAGVFECLRQAYVKTREPLVGWIVSPTYPMSEIVQAKFEEVADAHKLIVRKFTALRKYWLIPPASYNKPYEICIKTAERPDRLRGATLSFCWLDEAAIMPPEVFDIILPTLMYSGGPLMITTTPKGENWLYHKVLRKYYDEKDANYAVIRAKTIDNTLLDPSIVLALSNGMSNEMQRQELEGELVRWEGLVYKNFDFEKNVVKPVDVDDIPAGSTVIGGIDVGYRDPFVHLWVVKDPKGNFTVVDEYYVTEKTIDSHASAIKANKWDRLVSRRWRDPSAAQEGADLSRLGVSSAPAKTNDIEFGIDVVKRLIESRRLKIAENCVFTLAEIRQYHYTSRSKRVNVPADESNHAMDAMRYAIVSEDGWNSSCRWGFFDDQTGSSWLSPPSRPVKQDSLEEWANLKGSLTFMDFPVE